MGAAESAPVNGGAYHGHQHPNAHANNPSGMYAQGAPHPGSVNGHAQMNASTTMQQQQPMQRRSRTSTGGSSGRPTVRLHGAILGGPKTGKRAFATRMQGKNPFRSPNAPDEKQQQPKPAIIPYKPPMATPDRIQLEIETISSERQETYFANVSKQTPATAASSSAAAADFNILLLHPHHPWEHTQHYIQNMIMLLLRQLGYTAQSGSSAVSHKNDGTGTDASQQQQQQASNAVQMLLQNPLCLCICINFADLPPLPNNSSETDPAANNQKPVTSVERVQDYIADLLQTPSFQKQFDIPAPHKIVIDVIPISLKSNFGLAHVHWFVYHSYLRHKEIQASRHLHVIHAQLHTMYDHQPQRKSYADFLKEAEEQKEKIRQQREQKQKEDADRLQQQNAGMANSNPAMNGQPNHHDGTANPVQPTNEPSQQLQQPKRVVLQNTAPPPPQSAARMSLEDFLASSSDEEEEEASAPTKTQTKSQTVNNNNNSSDDDDDDYFYGDQRDSQPVYNSDDDDEDGVAQQAQVSDAAKSDNAEDNDNEELHSSPTDETDLVEEEETPTSSDNQAEKQPTSAEEVTMTQDDAPHKQALVDSRALGPDTVDATVVQDNSATNEAERQGKASAVSDEEPDRTESAENAEANFDQSEEDNIPDDETTGQGASSTTSEEEPGRIDSAADADIASEQQPHQEEVHQPPKPKGDGDDLQPSDDRLAGSARQQNTDELEAIAQPASNSPTKAAALVLDSDSDEEPQVVTQINVDDDDDDSDDGFFVEELPTTQVPTAPKSEDAEIQDKKEAPAAPASSSTLSDAARAAIMAAQQEAEMMMVPPDVSPDGKKKSKKSSKKEDKKAKKHKKEKKKKKSKDR